MRFGVHSRFLPRRPVRRASLALPTVTLIAAGLLGGCGKTPPPVVRPAPQVQVLEVKPQDVPVTKTWVTTLTGDVNAEIRAQVSGYLQAQNYNNGGYVQAGQQLFQIDPRPFQAALEQAQGTLAQAQAQLTASELTAKRSAELYAKNVISRQQYDDQTQAYEAAKASTQAAQAAVNQAQLNLNFTRITAPVDGLTSIATAQVGDLVSPSSGVLATVLKIDPIKVQFMVPEQDYINYIKQFFADPSQSPIGRNAPPELQLSLTLADGTKYPEAGKLTSVNNVVGISTGSITMQGAFPNPGKLLRPGQFGLVTATVRTDSGAFVVPQRAVVDIQGTKFLALVGDGNKAMMREVVLGPTLGSDQIVTSGLKAGDRVIVEGQQKVTDGTVVVPTAYVETEFEKDSDPTPTPAKG